MWWPLSSEIAVSVQGLRQIVRTDIVRRNGERGRGGGAVGRRGGSEAEPPPQGSMGPPEFDAKRPFEADRSLHAEAALRTRRKDGEAMHREPRPRDERETSMSAPEMARSAGSSADPGGGYLGALRRVQLRESEVLRMGATIQRAATCLEHWRAVHVVNAGVGFPTEVTMMMGRSIDASTWPTPQQLAETLADWHEAAEGARTAWAHLPMETRSSLPPPP